MSTSIWNVTGMTCGHCVRAVTEEIMALDGVESVFVDLATGVVTVEASLDPTWEQIAAAVDEAGYALV